MLAFTEILPGGRASGMDPSRFDQRQLLRGLIVELEHTPNVLIALEIAMDHLAEDPRYYEKLATIHTDGALAAAAGGDARADIVQALSVVLGQQRAEELMVGFEKLIEQRAKEGAAAGSRPWVLAALALGAAGVTLSGLALWRARQR